MKPFADAFTLLTIIPLPFRSNDESPPSRFAPLFFPLIGLLIGLFGAAIYTLLTGPLSKEVTAAITIAATVALTGGLHIDGLADFFDGLFGGRDKESRLRIMKQPDLGAFGVVAILLTILIEWTALSSVFPVHAWLVLPIVFMISRSAPLIVMSITSYVSSSGLGQTYVNLPRPTIFLVLIFIVASGLMYDGLFAVWTIIFGFVAAGIIGLLARWRIGGANGDVYGASVEITAAVCLVAATSLLDDRYFMRL